MHCHDKSEEAVEAKKKWLGREVVSSCQIRENVHFAIRIRGHLVCCATYVYNNIFFPGKMLITIIMNGYVISNECVCVCVCGVSERCTLTVT